MPNPDGSLTVGEQLADLRTLVGGIDRRLDELVTRTAFDQLVQRVDGIREHGSIQAQAAITRLTALEKKCDVIELRLARYPDAEIASATKEWQDWRRTVDTQLDGLAAIQTFKRGLITVAVGDGIALLGLALSFLYFFTR